MKAGIAGRMGVAIAGVLLAGSLSAQGPGGQMGPGMMGKPGFGEHRPPMEKAFRGGGMQGRWWNNPNIVATLKLTDEQRKAMDGILFEHREKLIDMRANVQKAELEMEPLMRDDQPNEGRILAQIDKVAQARAELEKANARFLLALRAKLTPEQWKQVQEFRANGGMRGRDGEGPGMNGARRMGPGQPGQRWRNRPEGPQAAPAPAPGPQSMLDLGDGSDQPAPSEAGAIQ